MKLLIVGCISLFCTTICAKTVNSHLTDDYLQNLNENTSLSTTENNTSGYFSKHKISQVYTDNPYLYTPDFEVGILDKGFYTNHEDIHRYGSASNNHEDKRRHGSAASSGKSEQRKSTSKASAQEFVLKTNRFTRENLSRGNVAPGSGLKEFLENNRACMRKSVWEKKKKTS